MSLDGVDRILGGQEVGEMEEASLEDRVDPAPETGLAGDGGGVDGPNFEVLVHYPGLSLDWKPIPELVGSVWAVDQDLGARSGDLQDIEVSQEFELVDRHEVGAGDQVRGVDRIRRDPQV